MAAELDLSYQALRRSYLEEMPARLADLRKDLGAFAAGEGDAAASLTARFHQIAGSGGSYGFPEVSRIARAVEEWLAQGGAEAAGAEERLRSAVQDLADALNAAETEVPPAAAPDRIVAPEFGWRAVVVGSGEVADAAHAALTTAGFLVERGGEHQEVSATPISERPDLVVLVGRAADFSLHAAAAAWSGVRSIRPRGVVLIDTGSSDRLMAIAAGVDMIYAPDQVTTDLPRFAKTLGRIGTPPVSVLLVEDDLLQAQLVASALEGANIRVHHAEDSARAQEFLALFTPDVFLLDVELPDVDGFTLARLIRQDPRYGLVPIVFLTARTSMASHIEALRAGADDFLTKPIDRSLNLLLQVVIARAERGRRIREMVHKDGLTGLLNHATLMAELHNAVEYAHRNSEHFSFLMVDIDHFKRVNDRYGHLVGDQVLLHVARLFQAAGRASDLIGRYGGEEFGMVLRRSNRAGAGIVAQKLRTALREHPAQTEEGEPIPVHVSIGVATYPEDGTRAPELAHAADLALYRAKTAGRNCVVFAATVT